MLRGFSFLAAFIPMPLLSFLYPWAGCLIWGWLALLNPHRSLWGFAASLPYNQIIAIPTLAGLVLFRDTKQKLFIDATLCVILMLSFMITLSTFYSLSPTLSWEQWNEIIKIFVYCYVVAFLLSCKERIHVFIWITAACLGYYGVQGGALFIVTAGSHQFNGPHKSYIADRNNLALAISMAIPLMNYLRLNSAWPWVRAGLLGAMAMSFLAVVGTYSRGGFIGLVAMGCFLWWRSRNKMATLAVILLITVSFTFMMPTQWTERIQTIQTAKEQDTSFKERLLSWQTYWAAGIDRPITGAGVFALNDNSVFFQYQPVDSNIDVKNDRARAAHSIYFQVIGETGFITFAFYMLLAIIAWYNTHRVIRASYTRIELAWANDMARMLQASFIAFFVAGAALSMAFYDLYLVLVVVSATLYRQVKTFSSIE